MKKAVIIGSGGQDGTLLLGALSEMNYSIIGIEWDRVDCINNDIRLRKVDICSRKDVIGLINIYKPDEIYYLAAIHQSSEDIVPDNITLLEKVSKSTLLVLSIFLKQFEFTLTNQDYFMQVPHIFSKERKQNFKMKKQQLIRIVFTVSQRPQDCLFADIIDLTTVCLHQLVYFIIMNRYIEAINFIHENY